MDFEAFMNAFTLLNVLYVAGGVFLGLIVGAIPGLSATMAIALGVPLTYTMAPVAAIGFLIGVNKGGCYGGSLSAILLNTPGSPEAAATTYDGYPLAQQGKALKAIKMSLYASVFGDVFSTIALIVIAAPIASLALKMGPSEILTLIIFSLTLIAALESDSLLKGVLAAAVGMLVSTIGIDAVTGMPRLTFGFFQLESGIRLVGVAIGMLALSELILQLRTSDDKSCTDATLVLSDKKEDQTLSWKEFSSTIKTLFRSSSIGVGIGALPGLGAVVAGFLSYGLAKKASDNPESFGKGNLNGVAAPESSNNAVLGAAMIPLFTLGIPGNVASALLIGAFVMHGVTPGPLMFEQHSALIYGIYGTMIVGNIMLLVIGYLGIRLCINILCVSRVVLLPIIVFICLLGAYFEDPSTFSVNIMVSCALLGVFMKKLNFSFVCFIVGFILGPMLELSFQQTIITYGFDYSQLLTRPATMVIALATLAFIVWQSCHRKKTS